MVIGISEKLTRLLVEFNPFWKSGRVGLESVRDREIYSRLQRLVGEKQIISICGLRRVGKTTLLRKIMASLVEKHGANSVLYFSFDDYFGSDLLEIIDSFAEMHGKEPCFLFFDEVQKLENWAEKVKILYDSGKYKIFLSGSESLFLKRDSRESLAGRIFELDAKGLSFSEYLSFVDKADFGKKPLLFARELQIEFEKYLVTGGFPELVGKDAVFAREYIRKSVIDKVVFFDIPKLFPLENPEKLRAVLEMLMENPGMLVDYQSLSQELGISRQTLPKYLDYLEQSNLVAKLYNYSRNKSTSEKKLKKYYPTFQSTVLGNPNDPAFAGKVVECICAIQTSAKFFWRDNYGNEADLVLETASGIVPVEIKYRESHASEKSVQKFCKKFGCKKATVITKNARRKPEKNEKQPQLSAELVPAREFLLKLQ